MKKLAQNCKTWALQRQSDDQHEHYLLASNIFYPTLLSLSTLSSPTTQFSHLQYHHPCSKNLLKSPLEIHLLSHFANTNNKIIKCASSCEVSHRWRLLVFLSTQVRSALINVVTSCLTGCKLEITNAGNYSFKFLHACCAW